MPGRWWQCLDAKHRKDWLLSRIALFLQDFFQEQFLSHKAVRGCVFFFIIASLWLEMVILMFHLFPLKAVYDERCLSVSADREIWATRVRLLPTQSAVLPRPGWMSVGVTGPDASLPPHRQSLCWHHSAGSCCGLCRLVVGGVAVVVTFFISLCVLWSLWPVLSGCWWCCCCCHIITALCQSLCVVVVVACIVWVLVVLLLLSHPSSVSVCCGCWLLCLVAGGVAAVLERKVVCISVGGGGGGIIHVKTLLKTLFVDLLLLLSHPPSVSVCCGCCGLCCLVVGGVAVGGLVCIRIFEKNCCKVTP